MMEKVYPFKFLDSYTRDDTEIFFGRDEEINILYEMIFQTDILLVYGASGTGKTSLIQCGLAKKLQNHDWLPIIIRRSQNINTSLNSALLKQVPNYTNNDNLRTEDESENTINLPLPFDKIFETLYLEYFRPIYLIFDQFEELYILGTKQEQDEFIDSIQSILKLNERIKIIIVIREEYLGHLSNFEKHVPQLLRKKIRIEPMNLGKVHDVLQRISQFKNSLFTLQANQDSKIIVTIFDTIKGSSQRLSIQLTYLQVFMDKLYMSISNDESRKKNVVCSLSDVQNIGAIEDVLKDFLDSQVDKITSELKNAYSDIDVKAIWNILSKFVTLEGTKEPVSKETLEARLHNSPQGLIARIIDEFGKSQIIRFTEDDQTYEITHDSLAQRIAEKRSDEEIAQLEIKNVINGHLKTRADARGLLTEKQLHFIEPYLNKVSLNDSEIALISLSKAKVSEDAEKEQKYKRRLKGFSLSLTFACLLLILFAAYSILTKNLLQETLKENIAMAREKAELAYATSLALYLNLLSLADASSENGKYEDAKNYVELAIKMEADYSSLADTMYAPKYLDNLAMKAKQKQAEISGQLSLAENLRAVNFHLQKGKERETEGTFDNPLIYLEAKKSYALAEKHLAACAGSREFNKLKDEIEVRKSDINSKLNISLNKLYDDLSKFTAEVEGYPAAKKLIEDARKISPNDTTLHKFESKIEQGIRKR